MIKLFIRFGLLYFLVLSLKSFGAQTYPLVNIELELQIAKTNINNEINSIVTSDTSTTNFQRRIG